MRASVCEHMCPSVFGAGSLTGLESTDSASLTSQQALGTFLFWPPPVVQTINSGHYTQVLFCLFCFVGGGEGVWESNSDPPACKASMLLTEPSPHPYFVIFKWVLACRGL